MHRTDKLVFGGIYKSTKYCGTLQARKKAGKGVGILACQSPVRLVKAILVNKERRRKGREGRGRRRRRRLYIDSRTASGKSEDHKSFSTTPTTVSAPPLLLYSATSIPPPRRSTSVLAFSACVSPPPASSIQQLRPVLHKSSPFNLS